MKSAIRWIAMAVTSVALSAQSADSWQHVTKESQPLFPGNEIQAIKYWAAKDQVWICTLTGAAKVEKGILSPLKVVKDMKVWDVTERPAGGFWVGHGGGALLVDGDNTTATLQGLSVASIQMVGTQLWAIAKNESTDRNTLMQCSGTNWSPVAAFKARGVLDLIQDAKGIFWAVLDGDGVIAVDPKQGEKGIQHHLSRLNVTSIMADSKGRVWCGLMSGGVMVMENNVWKRQLDKENMATLAVVEDGDGKVWVATSGNGLRVFDGTEWKGMLQDEGSVNLIKITSDKRVWISTQKLGGLRYWDGKAWQVSLESLMPLQRLVEIRPGVLLAYGARDGLYILGDFTLKGE